MDSARAVAKDVSALHLLLLASAPAVTFAPPVIATLKTVVARTASAHAVVHLATTLPPQDCNPKDSFQYPKI